MESRWYGGLTSNESENREASNQEVQLTGARKTGGTGYKDIENKLQHEEVNALIGTNVHQTIRIRTFALFGTAFFSNFFILLTLQLSWNSNQISITATTQHLQLVVSLTTLILISQIVEFYMFRRGGRGLMSLWMWLEICVSILHSPPAYIFNNDIKFGLLACLRVYHIVRPLHQCSPVLNLQHRDSDSSDSDFEEPQRDISFSLKMLFFEHPLKAFFSMGTIILFLFSYCIYVQERQQKPSVFTFGFSVWYTLMCMTTVGDDLQQDSMDSVGKVLSSVSTIAGISLFCIALVLLHRTLIYLPEERILVERWRMSRPSKLEEISSIEPSDFFADVDIDSLTRSSRRPRSLYGSRY